MLALCRGHLAEASTRVDAGGASAVRDRLSRMDRNSRGGARERRNRGGGTTEMGPWSDGVGGFRGPHYSGTGCRQLTSGDSRTTHSDWSRWRVRSVMSVGGMSGEKSFHCCSSESHA